MRWTQQEYATSGVQLQSGSEIEHWNTMNALAQLKILNMLAKRGHTNR